MSRREVRAGQTIKLRARFKDDLDDVAQASDVYIHLYEADVTEYALGNAYTVSGTPSYLGEGIYEYQFAVPEDGLDGMWHDQWEGVLTSQTLSGLFEFEVSASGIIDEIPAQLYVNNIVQITVSSGVQATDGTSLADEFEFEFLTTTSPSYTNIRKVRLDVGAYIQQLEDDVIQLAILESSIEADILSFNTTTINTSVYLHARRQWVTCSSASVLLDNTGRQLLKSKSLDNLRVEYNVNGINNTLDKLTDCLNRWEPQLLSGGGAKAIRNPQYVIKGDLDPDRPVVSRQWQSTEIGTLSRRVPVANEARKPAGRRRYLRTYRKKNW